jgi:hypothetical protein
MSEHTVARKRSRRAPESSEETDAPREEDVVSEATATPVDPKSTLSYRLALGAVIFLGALIVIGIAIMIVGLVKGWGQPKAAAPSPVAALHKPVSMGLEPGYRILSSDTQPGRLILHVRSDAADEIFVIDLNDGHIVATIHGDAPKQ